MADIQNIIKDFIKNQFIMSLATTDGENIYSCTAFFITEDGINLYFSSGNSSQHCVNIRKNGKVAGTSYKHNTLEGFESEKIGIQFTGSAKQVLDFEETKHNLELYGSKFAGAKNWAQNAHEFIIPDAKRSLYHITIEKAKMLDSVLGIKPEEYIEIYNNLC